MKRRWVGSPDYRAAVATLRAAREAQGLSQREVARRLRKPVSFLNKIELLERRIDILEFVQLCRALGVQPGELMAEIAASTRPDAEF
ncbi:MAG: helix-turn-helix domain-containing protein [Caulobacteraceae bacterium]|nr:helix-turn-helix domain-containing protein [Caulobacteraceae bacterium]